MCIFPYSRHMKNIKLINFGRSTNWCLKAHWDLLFDVGPDLLV